MNGELATFIADELGHSPSDPALFEAALTHSSSRGQSYERLEFLGDRVLGVVIARWLYERFPDEPEGNLSRRYNKLVARETCGEIGRGLGLPALIRLGKQARGDRANWSNNVVGDVVEALIGALFLDAGLDCADGLIRRLWTPLVDGQDRAPEHPKSALQELAAAKALGNPDYALVRQSGAHHQPSFVVRVTIPGLGEAEGQGASKQDAETAAAQALLDTLQ